MKKKIKTSLISSSAIVIAALIGVINYNIGEKDVQTSQNVPSVNVFIDQNVFAEHFDAASNLEADPFTDEIVTETYNIDELDSASLINVKVRNVADDNASWLDTVSIDEGEQIEFQIEYTNTSRFNQENIVISDMLPANAKYVIGTARKYDSQNPNGIYVNSDELFSEAGLNVGSYGPNANFNLRFVVEVVDIGLTDGVRTLKNAVQYRIGAETQEITDNYAYVRLAGWGPERPLYSVQDTIDHAVFNSLTDNPAVGDERDFVRIAEKKADGSAVYASDIEVEAEKEYEVFIYYHNNASEIFNTAENNYVGVARNTRLSSTFPTELRRGEKGSIVAKISAVTTDPEAVWDGAYITAAEDMTLHYVTGSAKIYNGGDVSGSVLSTRLFTNEGTLLGISQLNGIILGSGEYSGLVVYTIVTRAAD